jgi:hypothetical protein
MCKETMTGHSVQKDDNYLVHDDEIDREVLSLYVQL